MQRRVQNTKPTDDNKERTKPRVNRPKPKLSVGLFKQSVASKVDNEAVTTPADSSKDA
jgi:hypothetical protein